MQDNRDDLYLNLRDAGVGEDVIGTQQDFKNFVTNEKNTRDLYKNLRDAGVGEDVIGSEDDFYNFVAPDFSGNKSSGTTDDLSAATTGAKIGGNISLTPAKPNNQQTAQPAVDNTSKSVMDASGTPAEQAKVTGPKTQFVPADPNYVSGTPKEEALKKYPWMQPDQVYLWNKTTKEPVVTYVDESGQAVTDEDLQIKKAKSEITGQEDTEYMHPEAAALQLPNGNTRGVRLKKGALTQMADEIMRKEYGDNYLNTQFGRDGNVYTGAERRDLGAQQLYDELNSDVRKARISFAVSDEKDRNEILSRIKAKWGKVADENSLVNAVNDENAAKQDIDIVAQQNINDLNAEIQNISRQMDQRGAEIDNASSPFVDQTFNARDVDARYRLLQSKLNYAQNALKSWENVKNSSSLNAFSGFKDAIMDISAWDFGFSDLKNSIALLTAKGNDKQELVNLYGRYAEAAKFEDKYNPDSYRYGKITGTSMPYALQFAGTGGGFKSIGSAVSKKATSIAEKYALEGLKKQVVKGLGVVAGDIARAYTMSGTIQGLNTISDILMRSAGELTVDKQGNYQLKSDESLLKSIYKGVTASAIENYTEMLGERLNIGGNLMRMLPKIGLGRVSNAITKIGTQDWYRVCNNWLSRAGVNDFGGEVLEEEIGIVLNAALVGDNPLLNGSGGLLDVRTQKDILGGMLYSISAMRAGALAMYGVKKGVGSAFVKTLDMYDKMQLNQSDKGGQSIFGEGWTEIKDEIDNAPNEKVNAVIEKLAKEHPSKDEQSAIIDYAVKLLKTRGHNLGIAMASDGENDEGAQEEVQDMPDLSQPNAEYFNKDDGMIHKASLYPDASDPTGTAKDVFIIKGNLVTNEDGSINKDASDDTIIYIDGNGERHIASPDKFAAAYPPMSNNEVQQANEGGGNEEAQTTTFNKGDEVNINVDGNNYTATIQGTDGFGNYNVYYEDESGMMHPAKFTADQLNEMNGKSTVSNGQQATSEQPADVQQQVEQPVVEQSAQQEQETQQAQEEQKPAIPKDEKGNTLYHQVPVETTINDLYDGSLDDNEIRDFVDVNISEADKNLDKINKKAPKIGTNKDEYLKKKQEWQKQVEDATRIRDYWNSVRDYIAQQTHTTPEEVKAAQDELSGEAARREYQDMGENIQQDAVSVASDFIRGAKITPESFKAETGYGTDEQRKFVGMIAKAEKGGKTIDRLAEELVSYDNAEMNGVLFGGDTSSAKDAILSALQGAGTRGELKQTNEAEEQAYIDARNAARDAQYMDQYGMTYEEYLTYEEQIMPTIWREYNNYDETAFNNMYAEEIEQLIKSRENDTTGEEQADDRGNQVLPEQQVTEQRGSTGSQEQGTEVPTGVQGTVEDGVVPERTSEDRQEDGSVPDRTEEVESATEGLTSEDADNLLSAMEARAEVAPDIELTPTNWVEQFGEDGMVDTPIGKVKMGENQIAKLFTKGRSSQFGMIRPTLTNPDVIVEVPSSTDSANDVERPTSLLFIKAFLKNDGSKVYYFKSVTVKKDGLEVSVSSHLDRKKRVEDALRKGKLQYRFDGGAQTEHRPANVSVTTPLAGQGASSKGNATRGDQSASDVENGALVSPQLASSESKDTESLPNEQTINDKINISEFSDNQRAERIGNEEQPTVAQNDSEKAIGERLWRYVNFLNNQYGYNFEHEETFAKWITKKKNNIKWLKDKFPPNVVKEVIRAINDYNKLLTKQTVSNKIADAKAQTDINPTEAQKEAGNYKKGHVTIDGYNITIEQPKGSIRKGTDANDKKWEQKMNNTYGYIRGTQSVDGDHIDIFLSDDPTQGNVYVVDQVNPDGSFDEHKVMYGFNSADEAKDAYLSNYEKGWKGLGTITEVSKDEFKKWINSSHRKTKPFAEYKSVNGTKESNVTDNPNITPGDLLRAYESGDTKAIEDAENRMRTFIESSDDMKAVAATYFRSKDNSRKYKDVSSDTYRTQSFIAEACKNALLKAGIPKEAFMGERKRTDFARNTSDARVLDVMSADPSFDVLQSVVKNPNTLNSTLLNIADRTQYSYLADDARQILAERETDKADGSNGSNESDGRNESNASKEDGGGVRLRLGENGAKPLSAEETAIRDAVVGRLRESGLEVITDAEEGQRVLDEANGKRESRKRKSANNTALPKDESSFKGTVILFTDTANIRNNLETLASDYEKINNPSNKNVISELGRALNATHKGSGSQYVTIEAKNGNIVTIRLADHNVSVERMDNAGRDNAISIVISRKSNEGVQGEGKAHVVEYFYPDKSIRKAGGEAIASIARSLQQALYSGEYKDTTGLAEVEEVNGETIREQRVYHGSGADFEAFDHSHMGERVRTQAMLDGLAKAANMIQSWIKGNKRGRVFTIELPESTQRKIKEAMGRDLDSHNITANGIAHALKNHGVKGNKLNKNSIPLREEDAELIPYIMTAPDYVKKASADVSGRESVRFYKELSNGYVVVVEKEYKNSPDDMETITMWAETSSEATNARQETVPDTHVQNAILSTDAAKIRKDAETAIENDRKIREQRNVRFFRTPNGEAYGFTVGGRIYVDPRVATADTPIHEYAHLWASALRQGNPEEWRNVVGLMKGTPVWDEVRRRYPELTADDDIADEVLATYSGRRGAERLKAETRKAVDGKGVFEAAQAVTAMERVKEALRKFWKGVADFLHIHYTSAEEVADRVMSDLLEGRTLKDSKEHDDTANFAKKYNLNEKDVEDYADYMRRGNLNGASRAFKEIRRKVRLDSHAASLGQFTKIFSPIEKELYERFGNIDELRQQYVQRTLDERNAMEAARKKAEEEAEAERRRLQEFQNMSSEQLDAEYMKAVEANDEIRMRNLVNEAARRNGYGDTGSEYQGVGAWMAPGNPGYESDEVRRAAVANDAPDVNITDIANGYSQQPVDYFTNLHAYGTDTPHGRESAKAINNAIDEVKKGKNPMVKVYRAVPKSVKEGKLRNGDWVTPSRKYAEMHGDNRLEGDYRIIEQEVPASQLWWDGNDINEWGFDDGKGYAYRNTKNNRKLNDLITRDDKGNIIPLSQRFNARKADVRYRNTENQAATDNIEDVNKQFNQQLEGLTEENADKVTLSLGRPSAVLRAAGVEDKPMKLYGNKVIKKMRKHGFTLAEIKDLPRAVADPIAVFNNYQKNGNRSILTELQIGDKHILVSVTVGKTGVDADFNIVSSVFGKGSNNVVDWINKGYATFINKEKALDYLHFSERSISEASDNQELVSTANIIRNFENPNVLEENLVPTEQTNDIDTAVADTANKLNIGVRVAHSIDEVNNDSVRRAIEQGRRIQGFYDTRTGEIVVYAPNAVDAEDAVRTVLHEGVAHYGLRQLVGEENFNTFLDNIYNNVSDEIKSKVDDIARKNKLSTQVATEEYLAGLAEKTNFEEVKNSGIWDKIKDFFMDLLTKAGIRLNNALSDNELRYILWRSYDNLQNPTRDVINTVRDITKQRDLNVGNYAVQNSSGKVAENNNDEINRIVEEAKANGTYMKAPNGSDTNLNERQWAQVRTKAFKDWFGDWENDPENASKVVDENGEPRVVYHGTNNDFTVFDWSKIGSGNDKGLRGKGIYLSPNIKTSQSYGNNVITAFVNIKKPFRTSDFTSKEEISDKLGISEFSFDFDTSGNLRVYSASAGLFTDALKEAGYDGIIYPQRQEVIVYSPNQIKSATDNTGAFSSDDDDIRYRFIGETGARNLDAAEEATTRLDNLATARRMEQAYIDKKARIEKLRDSEPVEITGNEIEPSDDLKQYKKNALEYGKKLQGSYVNKDTGRPIQLQRGRRNGGVNEVLQHDYKDVEHLQSVAAIPQIIENSIYIGSRENTDKEKNPNVTEYQYYVCGLKIGNADYTVRSTIAVDNKGNRYYDHKLTSIEKGKLLDQINGQTAKNVGFGTTPGTRPTTDKSLGKDKVLLSLLQTNDEENARKIKFATGWERGADGKWRYETADFEYHPRGDARRNDKYKESEWYKELHVLEEKLFNGETLTDGETKRFDELSARVNAIRDNDRNTERIYLDDYVEDNELFKAYPELKQTKIDFVDLPNEEYSAKYNEEENRITVNQAKSIDDKSAIAHEVQHAIQHIEGFAQGSNVDNYNSVPTSENVINDIIDATDGHILDVGGFDNTPEGIFNALNRKTTYGTILRDYSSKLDDIANKYGYETIFDLVNDIDKFKSSVEMYLSEAGEVEARNAERRMNMTPEQRRQSLASETEDVAREDQLFIYDNLGVSARQGTGALTDSELSNANDPAGKMLGKPSRTPAQQKAFAERERQRMADRAREVADILHLDNVEIVTDASTLQGRRAKAKGFYSRDNGKIVIVVPNHVDMADIEQTVLHEAVAHYGLRKLFGSNFDTFLYNVYNNADMDVREKISQLAAQHNWNFATATEEYLASLAEKTNFENLNASWWDKIKSLFLKLLHSIGLKGFTGVSLSDNELRYILWRSYENLKNPGRYRSIIDEAKDITMQNELRVGNYSAGNSEAVGKAAENGVVNIEDVNRRFNEELGRLTEENAQSVILNLGRPGNFLLASGLSDRPIKLYGNKLLKKMRKHGFTTSDVKNLPKEINNPIAVFKGSVENSFAILTELEINGNNVLASISVGKGNDIDFNIISSVYGKNGNSVVSWINDGKILYVNKEKALNYLRISAPIAEAQDNQELSSAANIVKNFENPNISEENMRYGNGALAASESNGINKTNETNGQEAEEANRRFNEELNAFKAKTHKGLLHLGQPGRILNACGINEELTLSPTVLSRKLKQHGLNVDDIKGLAGAIQEPILVYQHGDAHPNMVIVTDLAAKGGKVSVAVELDGEGNVVELNNVSSVHSKGATTELERLSNMRDGYLEQALRWVDKNKVSDWLGIADLNSPIHANNPKLVSIANILQNFENPSVGEENILYREAKKVEKKINSDWRDEYDKKLSTLSFKLTEAAQDAMRSVKILQDIIAKETSAPISDDENVYWRENRLSSVNKYEQEYYAENYFKPIVTEIANLVKYGARYNDKGEDIINSDNDVLKYLIAKSGLERNQSKREVEAMNARKPYEDQIKELQKQVEKGEIKEENANKKIAKLQEQADKAEMNKRVAVLHKDYSGLTELFQDEKDFDTLATSYVSDFEKKFDTESLWNAINRATKETLRKAFVDGLISRESYESTAKMYKYYIPLRGWANDVASEAYNYKGSGNSSRKILQTAKGRTSLADNPISEIGRMMQDAIFQGNRNRMKQAVYNLAMNHDTSLLNIKRQWYQNMGTKDDPIWERVFPDLSSDMTAEQVAEEVEDFESRMRELKKEGKATQSRKGLILRLHTTKREEAQHRISVAINGKEYNIFVNGNPRAAQAINGELNDVDRYGSAVAKVNRFLSQVYTSINPEFVVTNYQRDAGFAASIVASTEPWSYQKEWAKNMTIYNPITTGVYLSSLIKKAKTGNINPNNKAERYMQEFLSNGGETGFTNMLSADDYKKQIKRDIKSINSVVSLPKAARAAVAFTERANTVFEDATRYATYVTSREQGRTIDRSIRDAKEISLNFNTRGADGLPGDGFIYRFFRGLRRWMIFVNPSIQGLNKAGMAFRNHPLRSSMMIAGLPTLLGYALPAIMQAVVGGGDGDDDDKNVVESYKDLPKWVRRTNIAIPIGGNNFVTIPLSYELRVSYGLGEMIWEYGEGMIDKEEVAVETLSQLSDLLPVSFSNGTVAQSISPSIARPLIDIIQNRNFYGKKIYNDSQFIEGYPEYMKAYAGTPKWLVKSTEVLNNVIPNLNAGVSDKYTPGAINVNPAIIDYLLSSYLGGLYNFPSKFGKTISMIWDEDMRDIQNVPIVSRNWKNSQSGNPYNSGDRYKTYMKEYDLSKQRFNGYKKEAEHDVPEFLKSLNDLLDTPSGKRMLMIDAYKRGGLDKLNQRIRDIDAYDNERYEGEKDALTKKRDEVKEELINKLDSISDGTLDFVNGEWIRK